MAKAICFNNGCKKEFTAPAVGISVNCPYCGCSNVRALAVARHRQSLQRVLVDIERNAPAEDARNYYCMRCLDAGCEQCVPAGLDSGNEVIELERNAPTPDPITDAACEPVSKHVDGNPKSAQGAKKYSLRHLPLPAAIEVNRALEDGRNKYGAANWRQTGVAATVYVDAALRHLMQWYDGGQKNASDSKVHNLGHAMACFAILIDAEANGQLIDDRPHACCDTDALLKRPEV